MKKYKVITENATGWKNIYIFSADRMTANKYSVTFYNADYCGETYKKWIFYKRLNTVNVEKLL